MKIKEKSNKKQLVVAVSAVSICIAAYLMTAYAYSLWPLQSSQTTNSGTTVDKKDKKNSQGDNRSNNEEENNTREEEQPVESDPETNTPETEPTYVSPPLLNPPGVSESYPIQNERYSISKEGSDTFQVTLYPIVNNPEYSDYNAQLKAYKTEVLEYLEKRHGDTNKLLINWSPSDAQNL